MRRSFSIRSMRIRRRNRSMRRDRDHMMDSIPAELDHSLGAMAVSLGVRPKMVSHNHWHHDTINHP